MSSHPFILRGYNKMVNIPLVDEKAILPSNLGTSTTTKYLIRLNDSKDSITENKRKTKQGDSEFVQYTLHVRKEDSLEKEAINFLFPKDLSELVKVYGPDSTQWGEKPIYIYQKTNDKGFTNVGIVTTPEIE